MACVDFYDDEVLEVVNSSLPLVTIDHVFNNRVAVLSDNVGGVETLVSYAYSMGHRKIAFIMGFPFQMNTSWNPVIMIRNIVIL